MNSRNARVLLPTLSFVFIAIAFALFLVIFAQGIGLRSVLSFVISILVLWKILVPLFLKGFNPIFTGRLCIIQKHFCIPAL